MFVFLFILIICKLSIIIWLVSTFQHMKHLFQNLSFFPNREKYSTESTTASTEAKEAMVQNSEDKNPKKNTEDTPATNGN